MKSEAERMKRRKSVIDKQTDERVNKIFEVWSPSQGLSMWPCFQLGSKFVVKLNKDPDLHADCPITETMVALIELIQQ